MAVSAAQQPVYVGVLRVDVSNWQGNWAMRTAEVSTSATSGTRYAPVRIDPAWSVSFPIDDAAYAEVVGFVPGQVINLACKHSATKCDIVTATIVENVSKTAEGTNDTPRVTITGKGGDVAYNQAIPT